MPIARALRRDELGVLADWSHLGLTQSSGFMIAELRRLDENIESSLSVGAVDLRKIKNCYCLYTSTDWIRLTRTFEVLNEDENR